MAQRLDMQGGGADLVEHRLRVCQAGCTAVDAQRLDTATAFTEGRSRNRLHLLGALGTDAVAITAADGASWREQEIANLRQPSVASGLEA